MNVMSFTQNGTTTICLDGELDHHAAKVVLARIIQVLDIESPHSLILDLNALNFMDSSGIAVVLQTHRRIKSSNGAFSVINVPSHAFRIFRAAGLTNIISMNERPARTERRIQIR